MDIYPEQLFLPFYLPDQNADIKTKKVDCFTGWQFGFPAQDHPMYRDSDCSVGLLYKNGEFHYRNSPLYKAEENIPSWGWPRFETEQGIVRARVVAPTEGQGSVPLEKDMRIELASTTKPWHVDEAIETTLEKGTYTCMLGKACIATFTVDSGHVWTITPEADALLFELWSSHVFRVVQVQERMRSYKKKLLGTLFVT